MSAVTTDRPLASGPENEIELGQLVSARLAAESVRLKEEFGGPNPDRIRFCVLDDLLPEAIFLSAFGQLPRLSDMVRRADMRERKFVSANLDKLEGPIVDIVLALADPRIAKIVAGIIGKKRLEVDPSLYNGGITVMLPGDFMCPHLDNSHDQARKRRRDVVLLYYFSPFWLPEYQGSLELWRLDGKTSQSSIEYKPNRLVILETTDHSLHSIQSILGPMPRASVTSYFYGPESERSPVRLTRFTSWPGDPLRGMLFDAQFHLRSIAARFIRRSVGNRHVYRPEATPSARTVEASTGSPHRRP
jgi:hypothetical protein